MTEEKTRTIQWEEHSDGLDAANARCKDICTFTSLQFKAYIEEMKMNIKEEDGPLLFSHEVINFIELLCVNLITNCVYQIIQIPPEEVKKERAAVLDIMDRYLNEITESVKEAWVQVVDDMIEHGKGFNYRLTKEHNQ